MGTSRRDIVSVLCLSLLLTGSLAAQVGGSRLQMGNHSIEVHVLNQSGAPLNIPVRVEILSAAGLHMAEAYSNREQGVTDFDGFGDGTFLVRVTGPEIEPVTQSFTLGGTEGNHREYVQVKLKDTDSGSKVSSEDDPKVSAQDLAVPAKARAEFDKGMEAYAKGDDKAAQKALERAIELYPSYVKAHNNLGVLYQNAGLTAKAVVEYSKAVEFNPKFAPGYVNLAKMSIAGGNLAEAEAELKKALAADPGTVNGMLLLCSTQFARKEYPDALATARRVHQLTKEAQHADVHLISADILIAQGKAKEAVSEYQIFILERPGDPRSEKVKSMIAQLSAR